MHNLCKQLRAGKLYSPVSLKLGLESVCQSWFRRG